MKTFIQFNESIKRRNSEVVKVMPVHGKHATPKSNVVKVMPVHGKHAKGSKKLSEGHVTQHAGGSVMGWVKRQSNSSIDATESKLKEHHKYRELPISHRSALQHYTQDSSIVNGHLIKHHGQDPVAGPLNATTHHVVTALDAVHKAHRTPEDMHVYTGTGYDPRQYGDNGDKLTLPAITSTSLSRETAHDFSKKLSTHHINHDGNEVHERHVLHIRVPKGHHGFYAGEHSYHSEEYEFQLPAGTKLKRTHPPTFHHDEKRNGRYERTIIHHYTTDNDDD